jgi:hypothetical protein
MKLVFDAAEGIGPWARDALAHARLACALVKKNVEALRNVDAQWPAQWPVLVVVPLHEADTEASRGHQMDQGPLVLGQIPHPVLHPAARRPARVETNHHRPTAWRRPA